MLGLPLVLIAAAAAPTLAQPAFNTLNVPAELATFCSEHLATELSAQGVRVITPREIGAMIGIERQKQLLGCERDNAASCMTELGNALGADGVLLGDLGRLGTRYQLNLRVVRGSTGEPVLSWSHGVDSDSELLTMITDGAREIAPQLVDRLTRTGPTGRRWPVWPTALSVGFVLAGVVLHGVAAVEYDALTRVNNTPLQSISEANAVAVRGTAFMWSAYAAYGLAAASLVLALVLYLKGPGP